MRKKLPRPPNGVREAKEQALRINVRQLEAKGKGPAEIAQELGQPEKIIEEMKTQRDITTLRLIQKLAATLRWPESRKVGATVSRLTDSRRSWKGPQRLSAVRRSSFPQIDEVEGANWLESMPVP